MKDCKLCGEPTKNLFNISFRPTPICEPCAATVFLQQAQYYVKSNK